MIDQNSRMPFSRSSPLLTRESHCCQSTAISTSNNCFPNGVMRVSISAVGEQIHAFNHYGQMVEYLRMNGIVPPVSHP
jgi:hypothetical protein